MQLEKEELLQIVGGISITSSLISSIYKAATAFMEIGRALGTAIRRSISGSICPV